MTREPPGRGRTMWSLYMKKICAFFLLSAVCALSFANDPFMTGLDAYARSDWPAATQSFRRAVALNSSNAEGWYWLLMSELSAGDLATSLSDMDRFVVAFPADPRVPDVSYQKGRALFLLARYEESIRELYRFVTSWPDHAMVSSAYYWVGECLYATGRYDEARSVFTRILDTWPDAVKREAAWYRLTLLTQTAKEEELLKLLKMSHEESLRIIEDYQRREKTYDQAITAYQKRISDMIKDTRLGELEGQLGEEKIRNSRQLDRISELEMQNAELAAALSMAGKPVPPSAVSNSISSDLESVDPEKRRRALEEMRNKAQSLRELYDQILEGGE